MLKDFFLSIGPAWRVDLPSKKGDPPSQAKIVFSCKRFAKFLKEM